MKRIDALVKLTVDRALNNDPKATTALLAMMRYAGVIGDAPEAPADEPVRKDDLDIVEGYLQRLRSGEPTAQPARRGAQGKPKRVRP
jgi:hypothetical protein